MLAWYKLSDWYPLKTDYKKRIYFRYNNLTWYLEHFVDVRGQYAEQIHGQYTRSGQPMFVEFNECMNGVRVWTY